LALPVADRLRLFILALSLPLVSWFAWEASYASEQWVLLVRELPAPKIAEVAKYLEGRRIPFEVKGGGHDLWVPAGLSAELTIEMDKHITGVTR
jgi:flagellar biosynthesis/type III secretory pathway M-ring protein FliF/YscJ